MRTIQSPVLVFVIIFVFVLESAYVLSGDLKAKEERGGRERSSEAFGACSVVA